MKNADEFFYYRLLDPVQILEMATGIELGTARRGPLEEYLNSLGT